jgi:undecaprenyl-diphosphatase
MSLLDAVLLGLVQGLAEFLPISSSGHLVLTEGLLGIAQADIIFEVFLHFSTLLAILIYFKKDILAIRMKEAKLIVFGSIPVVVVGLLFKEQLEVVFGSIVIVSLLLIVTGILNLVTDHKLNNGKKSKEAKKEIGVKEAIIIGIFQTFAILPGISRSGSTVAGGVLQNIERKKAFRFSFLLVIPVILGASFLQLLEVVGEGGLSAGGLNISTLVVGGLTAFISGFLSLRIFEYVINKSRLEVFGFYCIFVGVVSLGFNYPF